jgi:hypothetical protein
MASYTRLPKSYPQSLRFKPKEEPSPLVKARTHERKAEKIRDDDEGKLHLEFLERFKALEHAVDKIKEKAKKEYAIFLAQEDMGPHELIGHLIATLPKPRQVLLYKDERIADLNAVLAKRNPPRLIGENEMLKDLGVTFQTFTHAKRDLKFGLGLQGYRSGQALGVYLLVVRAACDPKVKKALSLVRDEETLVAANGILRDVATHVIHQMQLDHDEFYAVGQRKELGAPRHGRKI